MSFTEGIFMKVPIYIQIYSASPGQKSRQESKPCTYPAFHALSKGDMDHIIKMSVVESTEDHAEEKIDTCPFVIWPF